MLIEEELLAYLENSIKAGENKARDKQIIAFYYGFGDVVWPTLEQVAKNFGLNERERVRQIIKNKFQKHATPSSLSRVARLGELIEQFDFVPSDVVQRCLAEERLAPEESSLRGHLNLLEDLGLCRDFNIYDPLLRTVSRAMADTDQKSFLIRSSHLPSLRKALTTARTLPGLIGLARETYIESALQDFGAPTRENVLALLRSSRDARFVEVNGQTWYAVEGRDNTLVNSCEKIFGVIDSCDSNVLAEVLANSLHRRASRLEYPSAAVIERFLQVSHLFDRTDSRVSFRGQPTQLTDIESDTVAFLRGKGAVSYPEIKTHLTEKGYGKPSIDKATTVSPLVYVDKDGGRSRYTYQLVPAGLAQGRATDDARYLGIRARLQNLFALGTDVSSESTHRREQGILQDWLFDGKAVEKCAICDRTFSAQALVAAHKKKRSVCSDQERLDPYVVMPLCVFGCDFLYERGILQIADGTVFAGRMAPNLTHEIVFAKNLIGRQIDKRWLEGDPRYFDRTDTEQTKTMEAA